MSGNGGWFEYLAIVREAIGYAEYEPTAQLMSCPNDGEPYTTGPDGGLFCRFDGYRPDGTYVGDFRRSHTFTRP